MRGKNNKSLKSQVESEEVWSFKCSGRNNLRIMVPFTYYLEQLQVSVLVPILCACIPRGRAPLSLEDPAAQWRQGRGSSTARRSGLQMLASIVEGGLGAGPQVPGPPV